MKLTLISLGCDKNLVDSESMLGILEKQGYEFTDDEEAAEVIVINTCCFILDAKQESIDTILRVAEYKKTGVLKKLIVTGCLAQRYKEEILQEIPEVDEVMDIAAFEDLIKKNAPVDRVVSTGGWYEYLKIAEGCSKRCTYCIIPYLKGNYRSYPMEELLRQAEVLADGGVRELILVAQETTVYGTDLYGRKMLPELIRKLCRIDGIRWIRIMYAYPEEIDDALIDVMAEEPKVCHYIDMPIQHASDRVLRAMGRRTDRRDIIRVTEKLREKMPDIVIRTTLISGFPGETEEDHRELVDFVDRMTYERLGVFPYSPEEGTPAEKLPDQIPEEVKNSRRDEIMALQQEISADFLDSLIGEEMQVMVEGRLPEEDAYVCRSYMDAPDVDGYVFVSSKKNHMSGDFIRVRLTGSSEYDLIGEEI